MTLVGIADDGIEKSEIVRSHREAGEDMGYEQARDEASQDEPSPSDCVQDDRASEDVKGRVKRQDVAQPDVDVAGDGESAKNQDEAEQGSAR